MRWLLIKDLQILRRSPLLVGVLIAYPIAIALMIGFALSSPPGKPKVAFVSNNAHGFWTFAQKGAKEAADEFGVQLEFRKPSEDSAKVQREIIEDLMNRGYKGVAVSPNDPENNLTFFKNNVNSKIALVMADNDLPEPAARRCYSA